ncbi:MAG: N-formylglutamate amidohydrolase [Synergistales bacterium]|nr:N-formylglutamate amidohydrolase [Synergistales bacterium]
MKENRLTIAFESGQLTYSDYDVDLYNTGITQVLSVAAARGHEIYHFRMEDLYWHGEEPFARASVLELPPGWDGEPVTAHQFVTKVDERPLHLADVDICFARGDDIRNLEETPNIDILRTLDGRGALFESLNATLVSTDKYELVKRVPEVPQPVTFAASAMEEALEALERLPREHDYFIIKDRYGYGCGLQVHRVSFDDPELEEVLHMYLSMYGRILLQEFCPEVRNGDLVVTFFDGDLIAPMLREPAYGEWKTNMSFGCNQILHVLTNEQESIARSVIEAFPELRYASVDMLTTGKVIEINAFPGGIGLYDIYGISVGAIIMDRIESELLQLAPPRTEIAASVVEQPVTHWSNVYEYFEQFDERLPVVDVFGDETYELAIRDLVEFTPRSNDYILSIPHSGVLVPERFADRFDLGPGCLKEIDMLSDVLYEGLDGLQLISRLAPFLVDMNRSRDGLDDENLPFHLKNSATEYYNIENELLLQRPYTPEERARVIRYYDLYHNILRFLIDNMISERGYALILDAHSMSSVGWGRVYDEGEERSNFVVGTLDDRSADAEIIHSFYSGLENAAMTHDIGLTTAKNEPYSGGFITRMHNNPAGNVHVIQLEVTMDTYMYEPDEANRNKRYALKQPRLKMVRDIITHAIESAGMAARSLYS